MGDRKLLDVDADHGLTQAAGDASDDLRVGVVVGRGDDRFGPPHRVTGLEDPGTDEHALGTELHHHRSVGRSGDSAGGQYPARKLYPRYGFTDLGCHTVKYEGIDLSKFHLFEYVL